MLTARTIIAVWLSLTFAASSCSRSDAAVGAGAFERDLIIDVAGTRRVFDVYLPTGHDAGSPAPLVVLLHGQRVSRADMEGTSRAASPYAQWQLVADEHGIVLLIPEGAKGSNGHAGWNDCRLDVTGNPQTDDVAFLTASIDHVDTMHPIDQQRIYVVGTSNGGHMAMRLADEAPNRLAGIGVVAAGVPAASSCPASAEPMAAVFMWGTADPIAPYRGGAMAGDRGQILSAEQSIARWTERNGARQTPEVTAFEDIDADDGSTVERLLYQGDGPSVAFYRVNGGGHTEPSIAARYTRVFQLAVGNQNHDIEMATQIWDFFDTTGS